MKSYLPLVLIGIFLIVGITLFITWFGDKPLQVPLGSMRLTGVLVANKVNVSAKTGGRLNRINVKEGDWVKEGDVVAILDNLEVKAQRGAYLAQISQQKAKIDQLHEETLLEDEQQSGQLQRAQAQLKMAESQENQAFAEVEQHIADERRASSLLEESLIPKQEGERISTDARVAEARLKAQRDQVAVSKADLALARANQRQRTIALTELRQAEAELEIIRSKLEETEVRLTDTVIKSPLAGIVSMRVAQQGEVIRTGDVIITIVDLDDVWLKTEVEETLVTRVKLGMPINVALIDGTKMDGHITFISPEPEFATQRDVDRVKRDIRTFGIRISLPNQDHHLHPGMTVYAFLPSKLIHEGNPH